MSVGASTVRFCVHVSLHALSNLGSRARLLAAMVRMKLDRTRSTPRYMVCAMPPTVLAQPNGSSIFFRCFWDNAYPSCRVVRPSIAEYLDFWATWGVTQAWRRLDTNPAASYPLSAPSVSCRVDPGEWRWIMSSAALRSA